MGVTLWGGTGGRDLEIDAGYDCVAAEHKPADMVFA